MRARRSNTGGGSTGPGAPRFPALALALALVAGPTVPGCGAGEEPPADVLLITVDTLRFDHVSAYGHGLSETPAIDALAAAGTLFENHYSVSGQTAPSMAALATGVHPSRHGLKRNGQTLDPTLPTLPRVMQEAGYRTVGVTGSGVWSSLFGFERGFDVFDDDMDVETAHGGNRPADRVIDRALELLAEDDGRPVFLWVHLFDPHEPYTRPESEWMPLEEARAAIAELRPPTFLDDADALARVHAGYDAEVRFADRQIGRLLEAWDARPGAEGSVVTLTADHGEGLGEHAYQGHLLYLYEEQVHVPLVVRSPRLGRGRRVTSVTSAIDLGATLLQLCGVGAEAPGNARGFLPQARGEEVPGALAIAERDVWRRYEPGGARPTNRLLDARRGQPGGALGEMACVVSDGWKLVWSQDVPAELYDLGQDPDEGTNLADREDARSDRLQRLVDGWREVMRTGGGGVATDLTDDPEIRAMLEALGYL